MDWVLVRDIGLWVLIVICWAQLWWIRSLRKRMWELEWYRRYYWNLQYQNQGRQYWMW